MTLEHGKCYELLLKTGKTHIGVCAADGNDLVFYGVHESFDVNNDVMALVCYCEEIPNSKLIELVEERRGELYREEYYLDNYVLENIND